MTKTATSPQRTLVQQRIFAISALIIGLVFLTALVVILTSKPKPSASEISRTGQGLRLPASETISGGTISYKNPDGVNETAVANSVVITYQSGTVSAILSIQGLQGHMDKAGVISGTVSVVDSVSRALIGSVGQWQTTASDGDANSRTITFTDTAFLKGLADITKPVDLIVKPDNCLAVAIRSIIPADLFGTPQKLPLARQGDFNGDNKIDGADVTLFGAQYGKPVTDTNRQFDGNRDGSINGGDSSIFFNSNYNAVGASSVGN